MLLAMGIEPFRIRLTPDLEGAGLVDFFDSEVLLLNFPPGRKRPDVEAFMERAMDGLLAAIQDGRVCFVVFASSTSVYSSGTVREEDAGRPPPDTASGRALLAAEMALRQLSTIQTTVLRYGGLYGYERKPGLFLTGGIVQGGTRPVNLVHRDDAVDVTVRVIAQNVCGEVFNVCADKHPTRAAFYVQAAKWLGRSAPTFGPDYSLPAKIVLNGKLRRTLPYTFRHPDPMRRAP